MKTLDKVEFNPEMAKQKGFKYFKANILDLAKMGRIGKKEDGKIVPPSDEEIQAAWKKVTGKPVIVEPEKNKS